MTLARFDTLFLRLFVLMWATLVASHFVAYALSVPLSAPPGAAGPTSIGERLTHGRLPPLTALPPGALPRGGPDGPGGPGGPGGPPELPARTVWLDYALRAVVIALGAALGARWLATPVRRLADAADSLSGRLARGQPPQRLDERHGTLEVRRTARVFNAMAQRLQEQFDARGLHLAALSHDLRTPLTRLRMRLEDVPPHVADGAIADIQEMSEMMDGTLAVLREQNDGSTPDLVELRSVLEALVDDQRAAGREVALAAGAPLRARARPAALRRVLDNLVVNALRYGGSAQLTLTECDGGAEITVDDRGPGIPAEALERAFQPWVRLTTSHARAGHGLGLAIARDLAERDGGTLTLANRAGGGLRARLHLPTTVSASTRSG